MNFAFLKEYPDLKKLNEFCEDAEIFAISHPNISATSARKALEYVVKLIYQAKFGIGDVGNSLFELLEDEKFIDFIDDPAFINSLHYIRKMGNVATHDGTLKEEESVRVLEELHFIIGESCILLDLIDDYPVFVDQRTKPATTSPVVEPVAVPATKTAEEKKVIVSEELVAKYAPRMRKTRFQVHHKRDESVNKKLFLEASLREAGWPIVNRPNTAIPKSAAIECKLDDGDTVDYILYGRDNRPLAIIDYTTTSQNLLSGRMRTIEKANKLSVKYGYKPLIYYTNGYHIYFIDQLGYEPRRVFQFHSIEELELLKQRSGTRADISNPLVNMDIAGRYYQVDAIQSVCNTFMQNKRKSLLVMATGTGKTRVSIALADILLNANWVKNILFLADRKSLIHQAHKNFNKLLPQVTTSIYAGGTLNRDKNARIIFSTYQTMINLIDDDTREFSIGRFDLIIIDEAHRSIFNKYKSLFNYFDSLMIGLTATPRSEENKSTYDMFGLPHGEPDYAYELTEAVEDGFLVGYYLEEKSSKYLRGGIKYDDLTPEEKAKIEDSFAGFDGEANLQFRGDRKINELGSETNKEIINIGTIDAMLNDLMKNGLKIDNGDKLGKTIIFAPNHLTAELITKRFRHLYSHLDNAFCQLVDSQVPDALELIDNFGIRDKYPQICTSVDMLDTGIDVPDVLNLVFFKVVKSKIKFLQMIGRGTRLSPDIFGPNHDKQGFLIFDYFENFAYFGPAGNWSTLPSRKAMDITPQSVNLNIRKLGILQNLQEATNLSDFDQAYKKELTDYFISETRGLNNDAIDVSYNMAYVSKYRTAENWLWIDEAKHDEIVDYLFPLFPSDRSPVKVKNFDMIMYVIQMKYPRLEQEGKDVRNIRNGFTKVSDLSTSMMEALLKIKTIPAILAKRQLIHSMIDADYILNDFSYEKAEMIRKDLRDLMVYIPDEERYIVIDIDDDVEGTDIGPRPLMKTYKERAMEYIQGSNDPVFAKIRNLDELTEQEKEHLNDQFTVKLGTQIDFAKWSEGKALLPFIRSLIGIDENAIKTKFGSFMNSDILDQKQLIYAEQIVAYARQNGDITFSDLQDKSPFRDIYIVDLFDDKTYYVKQLINGLHKPVM